MGITRYTKEDLLFFRGLIEAGEYRAVIDRTYPLEDVIEASRYVETGRKTGNVVLTVSRDMGAVMNNATSQAVP
jgi:NADPH:quinone reductase-like Zn-dependent oxidoreductase